MGEEDSDEESDEHERISLVALKHRGKKKAIVPINRVQAILGREYMHTYIACITCLFTLLIVLKRLTVFNNRSCEP